MPFEEPVTMATFPLSEPMTCLLIVDPVSSALALRRWRRLVLLCTLRGPSSAQGLIELYDRNQMKPVCAGESQFGLEEIPLGDQHIKIVGESTLVAQVGEVQGRTQGVHLLRLRFALL